MKTTQLIYASFSETAESGVRYMTYDESMRDYLDGKEDTRFVTEVEFDDIAREEIVALGIAAIDKDIADLQVAINRKQDKKQQLLAIGVDA